ncbi:hypoxanthine-guanine phosphoribosyltransferase [Stylosanthes scabra]|uniref:Hypoxanthine-guanine phosphoribosyltransferase n=1 Tax=Stylosanthes scabra TaxID=79078 RepID=A0ABU6V5Z2_9FABA|nr:hypoxanthine-guanine phosphoribosyltransferase [Stylosanthes scabra]
MASTSSSRLLFCSSYSHPSLLSNTTGSDARRVLWLKNRKVPKEYCSKISIMQDNWKHSYKCIDGGSTSTTRKLYINATSAQSHESEPQQGYGTQSIWKSTKDMLHTLQKFAMSYFLITMLMSITSSSLLAVENLSDISPKFFDGLLKFIIPIVFMHLYAVGINQLTDIEIDKFDNKFTKVLVSFVYKSFFGIGRPNIRPHIRAETFLAITLQINKPYRPLASGKISYKAGFIFTMLCVIMSFGFGWMTGSKPLLLCLIQYFASITCYSINLPLLRWKKSTILTLLSTVPSMLISSYVAPLFHMKTYVLKKTIIFSRPIVFTFVVMSFYNLVIMLLKDIPDIEGDKAAGLQTLSVRLGPKRVFWLSVSLLEMAYGFAIIMGTTSPFLWSKIFTVLAHGIMALIFYYRANSVNLKNKDASQSFYMFMFQLLCVENILIHFVR